MQFHNIDAKRKKGNLERHFKSNHKNYEADFLPKPGKRRIQFNMMKNQLETLQSMFTKPNIGPQQQRPFE